MPLRWTTTLLLVLFLITVNRVVGWADSTSVGDPAIDIIVEDTTSGVGDPRAAVDDSLAAPDVMPEISSFVKAEYPAELLRQGITGTVMLRLLVGETGGVDSAVVDSGIHPQLDSAAVRAARCFRFAPAQAGGEPVAVWLQYAYRFTLDDVIDSLVPYENFSGVCIEKGTKKRIADAVVAITFIDSAADTALPLPWSTYLQAIGFFDGQQFDEGHLIAATDSSGDFRFYSLPACSIEVAVIVPGYAQFTTREKINRSEALSVKCFIERFSYSEYEVVVYGRAVEKEISRRQLSINEVRRIPGFGGDAIKAIQALPGVSRPVMGSGEIIVRGSPTWDSRFFLDGMEIPVLYHFGIKSTYNSEALSAIDFYPGGFGTRYGGSIAGIVNIQGRKGTSERIKTVGELSSLDGSLFIEGPIHDSSTFIATARRSFLGDILRGIFSLMPDLIPFSLYPFYWDYLLRADAPTAKAGAFSLVLFGSRDSLSFIFPEMRFGSDEITEKTDEIGSNTTFNMGTLGWDFAINNRWKNSLRYQLMNIYFNFTSPFGKEIDKIWVNHIRNQITCTFSKQICLNIGADAQWSLADIKIRMPVPGSNAIYDTTIDNWRFGDIAAYLNIEWRPVEQVQIIPGIRYDYYPELLYDGSIVPAFWDYQSFDNNRGFSGEPSARLTGRYEFIKNHTAKMAVGNYNQTPEPMGQVIMKGWGDPMMPATKATHYVGGYEWQFTDLINLDAQVYFNKQWHIPRRVDRSDLLPTTDPQPLVKKDGLGRMYGLELLLRHQQGARFFGWLAYTLSRSERFNHSKNEWEIYGADETHNVQLLGNWRLKRNWEAGFRLRYITGKPTTPVIAVMEGENRTEAPYFRPIIGEKKSERLDPFFQLDVRVDKKIVFRKWMLSLFWDLQNISWLVYKSPEMEIPSYDFSEKTVMSNFPMIAIGVKVEL